MQVNDSAFLYHGTSVGEIKMLEPRRNTTPGVLGKDVPHAVYATDVLSYAVGFAFPWSSEEGIELEFIGKKISLAVPKKFSERLKQKIYIYKVSRKLFNLIPGASPVGHNYWCHTPVPVLGVVEFESVESALGQLGCNIVYID